MTGQPTHTRRVTIIRVAAAVGTALIGGAILIGSQSGQAKPASSTVAAPRPCLVGAPGCGPLPRVPTRHTWKGHLPGEPPLGLLRPGHYLADFFHNSGYSINFSVPAGWRWDGRSLTRRKAAVSFYVGPIQVYADPCQWSHAASRKSGSVKAIANALAAQPDRYATRPRSIPQGLPGAVGPTWDTIAVRLTVPSNLDLSACVRGQYRTWTNGRVTRFQQGAGQRDLIWLAAMGNAPLIVDASTYPDTSARLVRQVDAILASVKAGGYG